jgi:uncharacterized protein involved in exopolysaccharide biosynthesis
MASRVKLSGQEIRRLKNDYADCQAVREDFERAVKAGVPGMEKLQERLDVLQERIEKLLTILGGVEL